MINGGSKPVTTLAEDFAVLGMNPDGSSKGKPARRILGEDVQTSGHGTSYPSAGEKVKGGIRQPSDDGHTNPSSAEGDSPMESRLRRSLLRGEAEDLPGMTHDDYSEGDDEEPANESAEEPEEESDEEEPKAESRRARARGRVVEAEEEEPADESDDEDEPKNESDGDDDADDKEEADLPPDEVTVGESVKISRPKGRAAVEARRAAYRGAKKLSESLAKHPAVRRARKTTQKLAESIFAKKNDSSPMSEIKRLTESLRAPTSKFDDYAKAFNAVIDLDESMVIKFGELDRDFESPRGAASFKQLAEAALARAYDGAIVLREMAKIRDKKLRPNESAILESRLSRLAKEQKVAFNALADSLASVGLYESMDDLPGVESDDIDSDDDAERQESAGNVAELGDAPKHESRRRSMEDAADGDPDFEGDDEVSLSGKPYAEMDDDEVKSEMDSLKSKMGACKRRMRESRRMGEDGLLPTDDHLHNEDAPEPVTSELPHHESRIRPRVAPRRR